MVLVVRKMLLLQTSKQNKNIMFTYSQHLNTKQKDNVYIFSTSKHKTKR